MIDIYNITGAQLRTWRKVYMKLPQKTLANLLGRSSRFVRDQEKKPGRIDLMVARSCRDIEAERYIEDCITELNNAAARIESIYGLETF